MRERDDREEPALNRFLLALQVFWRTLTDPEFARRVEPGEFTRLDLYEGVDEGLYRREITTTQSGRLAWVYVYVLPLPSGTRGPIDRWDGPRIELALSGPGVSNSS